MVAAARGSFEPPPAMAYNPGVAEMPDNVVALREMISECSLCPRCCGVDRTAGRLGACGIGAEALVASAGPHFGEEPVLVGPGGSGTIFLAGCNLDCVFCQNFDISHHAAGKAASAEEIARTALTLERAGCANVNFVSPTHVAHVVGEAIVLARAGGLGVPVVYNCGGYESVQALELLDGLIDIYMPDFKYADAAAGEKYSGAEDYPARARSALAEMYRQVGPLEVGAGGLAERGVLVRHLVLPGDIADSRRVIETVAAAAPGCTINVMGQYRPAYRAEQFAPLRAWAVPATVRSLREYAEQKGLRRVD